MAYNPYRMNRIYGGDIAPPNMPPDLDIVGLMNMINPMIDQDNRQKRQYELDDRDYNRMNFENDRKFDIDQKIETSGQASGLNRMRRPSMGLPVDINEGYDVTNDPMAHGWRSALSEVGPFRGQGQRAAVNPNANQPRLQQVAQAAAREPEQVAPKKPPMNYVYEHMSPYEQATINFKNRELDQKNRLGGEGLDIRREGQDQRNDLGLQRNNIADFKAKNPNLKFIISKGGNVVGFNPLTGESHDTGVSSGTLSERDRIELTGEQRSNEITRRGDIQKDIQNTRGSQGLAQVAARVAGQKDVQNLRGDQALEQIFTRGDIQKDIQGTRGSQALEQIGARGKEQRTTDAAKPSQGMQPTQAKVLESNKARELMNTRPDLAKFIKKDPNDGTYSIEPPGESSYFGADKPTLGQFAEINSILYPKSNSAAKTTTPVKAAGNETPPPGVTTADGKKWKYVRKPGGGWTAVPDDGK